KLEDHLWEFVFDFITNQDKYSDLPKTTEEIAKWLDGISEEDKETEILMPLKNLDLMKNLTIGEFQIKHLDEELYNEWASDTPWGLYKEYIGRVVLITRVKANSFWKALQRGKSKCFAFISLLTLLPRHTRHNKIIPDEIIFYHLPNTHRCEWSRIDDIGWDNSIPEEDDISYMEKWSSLLLNNENELVKCTIAGLKLLAEAKYESDVMMKLIKTFMALEAVLTRKEKSPKKYKIMFRLCLFFSRISRGFPEPSKFHDLYDVRNRFTHECDEYDWPETDLVLIKNESDSIIYWGTQFFLELIKVIHDKQFKNYSEFSEWLLQKDDVYTKQLDWFKLVGYDKKILKELK
ncbi:MAG: hypothetical protein PHS34_08155, partial [Candidatus Omnitrophica bacterium]|nr:hypothetical protein [Candidatus Omnitrophota bacterium]